MNETNEPTPVPRTSALLLGLRAERGLCPVFWDGRSPLPPEATHVLSSCDPFSVFAAELDARLMAAWVDAARAHPQVTFLLLTRNAVVLAPRLQERIVHPPSHRSPLPNLWLLAEVRPFTDFFQLTGALAGLTHARRGLLVSKNQNGSPFRGLFLLVCTTCAAPLPEDSVHLTPADGPCPNPLCKGALHRAVEWVILDGVSTLNLPFLRAARYGVPVLALDPDPHATRDLPRRWPEGLIPPRPAAEDAAKTAFAWPRTRDLAQCLAKREGADPHPDRLRIALLLDRWIGLHHLQEIGFQEPGDRLERTGWSRPGSVVVGLPNELSTYDDDALTRLVLLAHAHAVRVAVIPPPYREPKARRVYLQLSARPRDGASTTRHPTVQEALAQWWDRELG